MPSTRGECSTLRSLPLSKRRSAFPVSESNTHACLPAATCMREGVIQHMLPSVWGAMAQAQARRSPVWANDTRPRSLLHSAQLSSEGHHNHVSQQTAHRQTSGLRAIVLSLVT